MGVVNLKSATHYCRALIALKYFDGPTAGVGWLHSDATIYFKLVGWDTEQWQRLFATIPIDSSLVTNLQATFSKYESKRLPIWIPNARNDAPDATRVANAFEREIDKLLESAVELSLVESHDLLHDARVAVLSREHSIRALSCMKENRVLSLRADHMFEDFLVQM